MNKIEKIKILTVGNTILQTLSNEVDLNDENLKHNIELMLKFVQAEENIAIGLSAIQIGIPKRFFVMRMGYEYKEIINPIIIYKNNKKRSHEACLSVPGQSGYVKRYNKIKVTYYDLNNVKHQKTLKGLNAMVFQHELDHLNGLLFIDAESFIKD